MLSDKNSIHFTKRFISRYNMKYKENKEKKFGLKNFRDRIKEKRIGEKRKSY